MDPEALLDSEILLQVAILGLIEDKGMHPHEVLELAKKDD